MNFTELELRQKLDIHHSRKDFSSNINYVEFSFSGCFYEVFNISNSEWQTVLNGKELLDVLENLNIFINIDFLVKKYLDPNNHDVEVFHSKDNEQVFAYFDLIKQPTDQNNMFFFGLSCTKDKEELVHERLLDIYRKLQISTPFVYDIWNKELYYKVFKSYFYFYNCDYHTSKRQLNHHKTSC